MILGAGGDLTKRLLLPGLASLLSEHDYDVQVIGAAREELTDAQWRRLIRDTFAKTTDPKDAERRVESARYIAGDVTDAGQLEALIAACDHTPVIYFALPPAVTVKVCSALRRVDLPDGTRLALEKPFGTDLRSARSLNRLIAQLVPEEQVFRIDHFLGMSMVLNIIGFRFANQFFDAVWDGRHIERVEIVYDELLGLEGRGGYYDHAGALVDMLQSHLLEVLALVAMEQPPRLNEIELRSNAAQVLRATHVWDDDPVASGRRARYTKGKVGERALPSYADEPGVDPALKTETLAQVTLEIDTARWRGVPFVLRSGKAIGKYTTQVRVRMRPECWRIVEPVLRAWRKDEVPLEEYTAGSLGPKGWEILST